MVASRSAEILFVLIFIPLTKSKLRMSVLRRHVTFSRQLQVQEADHSQEAEKAEEEGRKAACGFGEIGENCDFTSPRQRIGVFIGVCWLRLLRQADSTGILGQPGYIQAKHVLTTHRDRPGVCPRAQQ